MDVIMYESFLKNIAKHVTLNADEIALITSRLKTIEITRNTVLLEGGTYCRDIYFVEQGCLRIYSLTEEGEEINVLFAPENWWAADLHSFNTGKPASFAIDALESSVLTAIDKDDLEFLLKEVPALERFFRILFLNGFSLFQRRLALVLSSPAAKRYQLFSKQYPTLKNRLALKHIASYLGISAVFLSNIRKKG